MLLGWVARVCVLAPSATHASIKSWSLGLLQHNLFVLEGWKQRNTYTNFKHEVSLGKGWKGGHVNLPCSSTHVWCYETAWCSGDVNTPWTCPCCMLHTFVFILRVPCTCTHVSVSIVAADATQLHGDLPAFFDAFWTCACHGTAWCSGGVKILCACPHVWCYGIAWWNPVFFCKIQTLKICFILYECKKTLKVAS